MPGPTNSELAEQMSDLFNRMGVFIDQFRHWITGTDTGGPNSDGYYELTDPTGFVNLIPSPVKMSMMSKDLVVGDLFGAGPFTMGTTQYNKLIKCSHTATMTITLPRNAPVNRTVSFVQVNSGSARFGVQSGGLAIRNRQGYNATAAQWAVATAVCVTNSNGNNAEWLLMGDLRFL